MTVPKIHKGPIRRKNLNSDISASLGLSAWRSLHMGNTLCSKESTGGIILFETSISRQKWNKLIPKDPNHLDFISDIFIPRYLNRSFCSGIIKLNVVSRIVKVNWYIGLNVNEMRGILLERREWISCPDLLAFLFSLGFLWWVWSLGFALHSL